ncbi:MAG TPA: NAD(P)-binding domain-containing protein, partial [Gammaproteobacteria bacterium]|nr:NAD(P)-binding domain-containing protein [Gammaproteobacteria bacterium]
MIAGGEISMLDVVIVGAGAAGLSAAITAQEQGLSYLVLEQRSLASTVAKMPKRKRIFNTPMKLPLRGSLWFGDTTREELLDKWHAIIGQYDLQVREREGVLEVIRRGDTFHIRSDKYTYEAMRVVLAIGAKGNPRKLGVSGEEESPKVFYWLSDPEAYADQDILVVGGGDSAIEAALALCERNRVHLSYRRGDFFRLRHRNASAIDASIREGRITVHMNSQVIRIDGD